MANLLFPANLKTYFLDKQGSSLLFPNTTRSKRKNQSFIPVIFSTISLSNVTFW
ncbi:BnaCnng70450D [Brassica napus]|uniref:BnaCnng70450D protein n=1 Tax=Brassica napus TaxID=3708 RepID=A0A078JX00_BRANA|nr:BnaCnng70450D [Brassica napus]